MGGAGDVTPSQRPAVRREARHRAVRPSDGVTPSPQPNVTLYEPTGTRASRTNVSVEAVPANGAVVAARDERRAAVPEGDVLRRRAGREARVGLCRRGRRWRSAARRPDVTQTLVPSGAKTTSWARNGGANVRTSRGRRGSLVSRIATRAACAPEDGPQRPPVRADRHVPSRARAPTCARAMRAAVRSIDDDRLCFRVGDVRELRRGWTAVYRGAAKPSSSARTRFRSAKNRSRCHRRGASRPRAPSARRPRSGRGPIRCSAGLALCGSARPDASRHPVEDDDMALEIGGDERDQVPPSRAANALGPRASEAAEETDARRNWRLSMNVIRLSSRKGPRDLRDRLGSYPGHGPQRQVPS